MTSLILASGSAIRAQLLENAGLHFTIKKSDVDEAVIKDKCRKRALDLRDTAMLLAEEKARAVAAQNPESLVIGADQILTIDKTLYDKATSMEEAAERLKLLSGRSHVLYSAVCVMKGDDVLWQTVSYPRLTMHKLDDEAIAAYLDAVGEGVLSSVGVYQLEGRGIRLFSAIEGDYFAILGLPLIPLLNFLRTRMDIA